MLKWLFCDSPFWSSLWNNLHTLHSPFWYLVPNQYYIQILLYHVLNTNHCGIMVWHNYTFGIPLPIKLHKAKACFVFYSNLIPFVLQGLSGAVSPKLILFFFPPSPSSTSIFWCIALCKEIIHPQHPQKMFYYSPTYWKICLELDCTIDLVSQLVSKLLIWNVTVG